jgi:hypothetical protein
MFPEQKSGWYRAQAAEYSALAEKATDPIKAFKQAEADRWVRLAELAEKDEAAKRDTLVPSRFSAHAVATKHSPVWFGLVWFRSDCGSKCHLFWTMRIIGVPQVRAVAALVTDPYARKTLLSIAASYDALGRHAERRLANQRGTRFATKAGHLKFATARAFHLVPFLVAARRRRRRQAKRCRPSSGSERETVQCGP